jgi:hypothetical protein
MSNGDYSGPTRPSEERPLPENELDDTLGARRQSMPRAPEQERWQVGPSRSDRSGASGDKTGVEWTLAARQIEKSTNSALQFNNDKRYSVDTIRRLEALFGLGNSPEGEGGKFSGELVQALTSYQHSKGLEADGKLGTETFESLRQGFPWMFDDKLSGSGSADRQIIPNEATEADRYSYYEQVVKDNFGVWRSQPGEINIIGIRGMQDGTQVQNVVGQSNDTIAVAWVDSEGVRHIRDFAGSVDPGRNIKHLMNPKGLAHLKDGSYVYTLGWHPWNHEPEKLKSLKEQWKRIGSNVPATRYNNERGYYEYEALVQKSPVTVYRDKNLNGYIGSNEMQEDRSSSDFGIHIHYSETGNPWSQGCQVIAGARPYLEFMQVVKQATNGKSIPYTLIDASKLDVLQQRGSGR